MPKAFDACVKGGGRVRTVTPKSSLGKRFGLDGDKFTRVCFPKGGGEMVRGETKTNQKMKAFERGKK